MELKQLEYFLKVAEYESFTRAADELYVTQPAISRSIRLLEEELGHTLFHRKNQKITLNEYGRTYRRYAQQCFSALSGGKRALDNLADETRNTVMVSVTEPDLYMELLEHYLDTRPEIRILQPAGNQPVEQLLLDREIDFCISTQVMNNPNLEWHSLLREPVLLLIREEHPLAGKEWVLLTDVAEEPWVMPVQGTGFRDLVDAYFERAGFAPRITYEVNELAMIRKMVELGLGVALFPATAYLRVHRGSKTMPKEITPQGLMAAMLHTPRCEREIGAYTLKDSPLSGVSLEFYQFTEQFFAGLSRDIRMMLDGMGEP